MRQLLFGHPPGQPYTCQLPSKSGQFTVTVGGVDVEASVAESPDKPGHYDIEIPGTSVGCPGPIVIVTDEAVVVTEPVTPCDGPFLHLPRRRTLRGPRH